MYIPLIGFVTIPVIPLTNPCELKPKKKSHDFVSKMKNNSLYFYLSIFSLLFSPEGLRAAYKHKMAPNYKNKQKAFYMYSLCELT